MYLVPNPSNPPIWSTYNAPVLSVVATAQWCELLCGGHWAYLRVTLFYYE